MPNVLTANQIAGVAQAAGFVGNDLVTAVAIVFPESGGDANQQSHNNNGSTDYGLWQINSVHADLLKSGSWSVPLDNAKMAFSVYQSAGHRFTPWVTYNRKLHLPYMAKALAGVASVDPAYAGGAGTVTAILTSSVTPAPSNATSGILGSFKTLTAPNNWWRIGMFVAGVSLLHLGVEGLTSYSTKLAGHARNATGAVKKTTGALKKIAEVAAV